MALWTIVLAGGTGRRLAGVTGGIPKQFWSPDGGPSLVEQTVLRAAPLVSSARTTTVIDRSHRHYIGSLAHRLLLGHVLEQPADRGTAAGVLFALSAVSEAAPDAVVLLTPSDHAVARQKLFHTGVLDAASSVESGRAAIVLFGIEPDLVDGDYGWIMPGRSNGHSAIGALRPVVSFDEKPSMPRASWLLAAGAVWNTMVLVARARALLDLYRRHLPDLTDVFVRAWHLPPDRREAFLTTMYPHLSFTDFSRDVLTPAEGLVVYTWPASLGWTDLGTPERLARWRGRGRGLASRRGRQAQARPAVTHVA